MKQPTQAEKQTGKTVLIVDDDPAILKFTSTVLSGAGYALLTAASGEDALRQSRDYNGTINLLLSNIQMNGMTGIDLGTKISIERPGIRVMLMSGFTEGMLILNEGWHFIPKPFVPSQLRDLVSALLLQGPTPDINEHAE